jgi:hypothetical protein
MGTGGYGLQIPYTHSEDKPSEVCAACYCSYAVSVFAIYKDCDMVANSVQGRVQISYRVCTLGHAVQVLLAKSEMGFAHTGLLLLMGRTPQIPVVKEIKPGAMVHTSTGRRAFTLTRAVYKWLCI